MKPKYQIIFLGNTPYEVMGMEAKLRAFGNPANTIDLNELPVQDEGYEFIFDRKTNSVIEIPHPIKEGFERILLPLEIARLTEQCKHEDIMFFNDQNKRYNWGIYLADDYLRGYLEGRPVEFDFDNTRFTLDVNRAVLWENDNPENVIRLNEVYSSPWGYELQYDASLKNVVYPQDPESDLPIISFDQLVNYDPLGMALKYNISIGRLPAWDNDLNYERVLVKCREFNGDLSPAQAIKSGEERKKEKTPRKSSRMKR